MAWLLSQSLGVQVLCVIGGLVVVLGGLWILVSAVFLPVLALIQRLLASAENSTVVSQAQYLIGTLTLDVAPQHTGEVMVQGGGKARQTYPAKLWPGESTELFAGTQVVVVSVTGGIAYVQQLRSPAG